MLLRGNKEKTRVFLVYPPTGLIHREDRCQVPSRGVIIAPVFPPTDLMYMAAVAEAEGCVCKISDYTSVKASADDFVRDLQAFAPDYLVISATTPTLEADLSFCALAKGIMPGICIIAKGAHFLRHHISVLSRYHELDMVIGGETEQVFRHILEGRNLKDIPGLCWRSDGVPVHNPGRTFVDDLDTLPFPARHLIDNERYVRPNNRRPMGIIRVSRGCPYHCFFCLATPVSGMKVRLRSPRNILEELRLCIDRYRMQEFIFYSDVFNVSKEWVIALCEELLASGLRFSWSSNMRVDCLDSETARYMRRAGCALVSVGVESGNQTILDKIGKHIKLAQVKECFAILKEAGMKTLSYYVLGSPWETAETVQDTIRFARNLDSDYASFFSATPFPGTKFYEYALEYGLLNEAGSGGHAFFRDAYFSPAVRGHYLDSDAIRTYNKKAVREFYLRPRYVAKRLMEAHVNELVSYARTGLSVVRHIL